LQVVAPPEPVRPIVVVKVGGEVIFKEPETLTQSIAFLKSQALSPIVIHGGGPQLNDELAKAGVEPQYIGGHRVTDPATMKVAQRVFESANDDLAKALAKGGLSVHQIKGGAFLAEVKDQKLGLVGEIKSVVTDDIEKALSEGKIPVLTSLGLSKATGSTLNINADVAARDLSIALKPVRVVYISAGGGWKDGNVVVSELNMAQDYDNWVKRDYTGRQGTLLKLNEMKAIVDGLPPTSSVTIASAAALASQLLPHKGPGSQIRRGVKLLKFDSLGAADGVRLRGLLSACGDESSKDALRLLDDADKASKSIDRIIATEDWSAAAVVTKAEGGIPVLHALALAPQAYWEGSESALWKEVIAAYPNGIAWLARDAKLPAGYNTTTMGGPLRGAAEAAGKDPASVSSLFPASSVRRSSQHATASVGLVGVCPSSAVMFRGPSDSPILANLTTTVAKTVVAHVTGGAITSASAGATVASGSQQCVPAASASNKKSASPLRVGLLGARGYVGRELVRLIGQHPDLQVTCASSRAFKGQDVLEALGVTDAAEAVTPGLKMSDVGPEQIRKGLAPEVDVWVLALPNGLCAEHAAAIEHHATVNLKKSKNDIPLLVDLSADMRFVSRDSLEAANGWVYGMPERPGARDKIKNARKIANPGCYATGAQMALLPLLTQYSEMQAGLNQPVLSWSPNHKPHVFGVSGYSGAGTTPSDKNDPDRLRDNLLPYSLVGHIHERNLFPVRPQRCQRWRRCLHAPRRPLLPGDQLDGDRSLAAAPH
jgi:N-acetyl-gamma-glutamyl-phosphate reductase / acetylglutamate kinase